MVIAGDGFTVRLAGDWRAKVEETWQGGRRREIVPTVPIAQQFLLANSPVADMMKSPVDARPRRDRGHRPQERQRVVPAPALWRSRSA